MKVLLINPPIREWAEPNNPPLGLLYLASYLEANGHKVDVFDANATRKVDKQWPFLLKVKVTLNIYDFIGLSGLISTAKVQKEILEMLNKQRISAKIILGGGLATASPEFAMRNYNDMIDYIIVDEGETSLLQLVEGHDPSDIPNLFYKDNKGCWCLPEKYALVPNLDSLPYPDYSKTLVNLYLENPIWGRNTGNSSSINYNMKRSLNMVMSRGCPFKCNFCLGMFKSSKCKYRLRSVDNVIEEISKLYEEYDIDFIGFVDDNTCLNKQWVEDFSKAMIKTKLNQNTHWGGSARVDEIDQSLLSLMREAGCEFLGVGMESADPKILGNMNKHPKPEKYIQQAIKAIKWIRDADITCNMTFIAGYVGETWDTLKTTAQFMVDNDVRNNMFYATPYPGTKLFEQVEDRIIAKYGSIDNYIWDLGDATEFRINCSELSDEELIYARKCALAGKPDLINGKGYTRHAGEGLDVSLDPLLNNIKRK